MTATLTGPTTGPATRDPELILTALYDEHAAAMFRWVHGMLGRREDAEDIVHAVWLKLAGRPERLITVVDLPAYAWTAVRHQVRSALRRRALEQLWTVPAADDDLVILNAVAEETISADARRDLARAVRRLRPKLRAVVLLVGVAGFTVEEAARRLGIPRGTASSRHHAAVETLRTMLRKDERR